MRVGINRKSIDIGVADKTFTIGLVPIHVNTLVVEDARVAEDKTLEFVDMANKQVEITYECVSDILEANGYTFYKDWWEKNMDFQGMQEFVASCLAKDIDTKKKAPVKEQA